jgi:hypothetical protein
VAQSRRNRSAHFPLIAQAIAMSIKNEVQYIAKVSELLSETERDQFVRVLKTRRGGAGWNAESPLMISPSKHPPASPYHFNSIPTAALGPGLAPATISFQFPPRPLAQVSPLLIILLGNVP